MPGRLQFWRLEAGQLAEILGLTLEWQRATPTFRVVAGCRGQDLVGGRVRIPAARGEFWAGHLTSYDHAGNCFLVTLDGGGLENDFGGGSSGLVDLGWFMAACAGFVWNRPESRSGGRARGGGRKPGSQPARDFAPGRWGDHGTDLISLPHVHGVRQYLHKFGQSTASPEQRRSCPTFVRSTPHGVVGPAPVAGLALFSRGLVGMLHGMGAAGAQAVAGICGS